MAEPRKKKESESSELLAACKRQERADRLLLAFWIGVMLLVLGAGFFLSRILASTASTHPVKAAETLMSSGMVDQINPRETLPAPAGMQVTGQPETLVPSATPAPTRIITYDVQPGDTFAGIAKHFEVDLYTLTFLNPDITPEILHVGDELNVPVQGGPTPTETPPAGGLSVIEYQVVSGDTLAGIAGRFGSSIDAIVRENGLESPDQLRVGQTLRIPVAPGSVTPPPPTGTSPVPETPTAAAPG